MCLWFVILEHEDKNAMAELIWRLLIATMKTSIHISRSKLYFHVQRTHHDIHIFDVEHNVNLNLKTGTVRVDLIWRLNFMFILSPLSNTLKLPLSGLP